MGEAVKRLTDIGFAILMLIITAATVFLLPSVMEWIRRLGG